MTRVDSRGSPEVRQTLVSLVPGPGAGLEHETYTGTITMERTAPELQEGPNTGDLWGTWGLSTTGGNGSCRN